MERRQIVHTGDVGAALEERQGLGGLLHTGVEVADDRLDPADDLTFQLDVEPQHPMGGRMLGPHVDDHPLVVIDAVVDHPVVDNAGSPLLDAPLGRLVALHLLSALVGPGHHPLGDLRSFGAGHPDVGGGGRLGHHVTRGEALNWTGTAPTSKSRRRGWPIQSSGIRMRVRSGWPAKRMPNMSYASRSRKLAPG